MADRPGPPVARAVHELPGRLRVRVPARQGDRAYFADVAEAFDLFREVLAAEGNPRTGSILIRHEATSARVWAFAETHDLFVRETAQAQAPGALDRMIADARQIDGWFRRSSGGELDLGTLVTMGLVGMSAYQIICGRVLAPAVTLSWYAAQQLQARAAGRQSASASVGAPATRA